MKEKIKNIVKYNRWIYNMYFLSMMIFTKILNLFFLNKKKVILFSSFGGKGFNDSPLAIYNYLIENKLFEEYEFIWAFEDPEKFPDNIHKVKIDTFRYYKLAISSKVWVTNSSMERGLKFKSSRTFCLNTWHGTPLKKMGLDISSANDSFKGKGNVTADVFCVQGDYEAQIFSKVFNLKKSQIKKIGLPRNDILKKSKGFSHHKKIDFGVKEDNFIVLYAPTFREFEKEHKNPIFSQSQLVNALSEQVGKNVTILVRAHYEISQKIKKDLAHAENVIDVSDYGNINDLYDISDCLISDYSSVFFDFSITNKPMIVFQYDLETYLQRRGLYFDITNDLPSAKNISSLVGKIKEVQKNKNPYIKKVSIFRKKYVEYYGNSTKKCVDILEKTLL